MNKQALEKAAWSTGDYRKVKGKVYLEESSTNNRSEGWKKSKDQSGADDREIWERTTLVPKSDPNYKTIVKGIKRGNKDWKKLTNTRENRKLWRKNRKSRKLSEKAMNKQALLEDVYNSAFEDELEKIASKTRTPEQLLAIAKRFKGSYDNILNKLTKLDHDIGVARIMKKPTPTTPKMSKKVSTDNLEDFDIPSKVHLKGDSPFRSNKAGKLITAPGVKVKSNADRYLNSLKRKASKRYAIASRLETDVLADKKFKKLLKEMG